MEVNVDTQPFGVVKPPKQDDQKGVVIDLVEVRKRLAEKANPTPSDFLEALDAERAQVDLLTQKVDALENERGTDNKNFKADVTDIAKPIVAQAIAASRRKTMRLQATFGLIAVILCLFGIFSFKGVYRQVDELEVRVDSKASWEAVGNLYDELLTKATKAELKVVATKADKSVVERLADEIRSKDSTQDKQLTDLATDLMSKANKEDVDKLSARLRATRKKVRSLEQRMKDLAVQPAGTSDVPESRPKTM